MFVDFKAERKQTSRLLLKASVISDAKPMHSKQ